jgi:hypothetical protein
MEITEAKPKCTCMKRVQDVKSTTIKAQVQHQMSDHMQMQVRQHVKDQAVKKIDETLQAQV